MARAAHSVEKRLASWVRDSLWQVNLKIINCKRNKRNNKRYVQRLCFCLARVGAHSSREQLLLQAPSPAHSPWLDYFDRWYSGGSHRHHAFLLLRCNETGVSTEKQDSLLSVSDWGICPWAPLSAENHTHTEQSTGTPWVSLKAVAPSPMSIRSAIRKKPYSTPGRMFRGHP